MDNLTCLKLAADTTDLSHLGLLACLHQIFQNLSMIDQISHLLSKWLQHQCKMKILIYKIDIIIIKTKAQQVIWTLLMIYFHQRQVPKTSNLKPWLLEEPVATYYLIQVAKWQELLLLNEKSAWSQDYLGSLKARFQVGFSKCKIKVESKFIIKSTCKVVEF